LRWTKRIAKINKYSILQVSIRSSSNSSKFHIFKLEFMFLIAFKYIIFLLFYELEMKIKKALTRIVLNNKFFPMGVSLNALTLKMFISSIDHPIPLLNG